MMGLVAEEVGVAKERLIVLGRRLVLVSSNIGAAVAIIFGFFAILAEPGVLRQGWLHAKLALVLLLLVLHLRLYQRIRAIEDAPLSASRREFSIIHGIVSLLLLGTLVLVLVKPF
jgi:putative membrane protein